MAEEADEDLIKSIRVVLLDETKFPIWLMIWRMYALWKAASTLMKPFAENNLKVGQE